MNIARIVGMAALVAVAGCMSTECRTPSGGADLRPLRVAVYVGEGARSTGAYRWLEIATTAEDVVATPVDGAAVRAGALDAADVLVMPGGRVVIVADTSGKRKAAKWLKGAVVVDSYDKVVDALLRQ